MVPAGSAFFFTSTFGSGALSGAGIDCAAGATDVVAEVVAGGEEEHALKPKATITVRAFV
jgi:hypothetical protein